MDDLGVADELQRHEPDRARDVVVGDGVLVAVDRRRARGGRRGRARRGATRSRAGPSSRPRTRSPCPARRQTSAIARARSSVAARDHDRPASAGVGLGQPQADPRGAADDDDGSVLHRPHDRPRVQCESTTPPLQRAPESPLRKGFRAIQRCLSALGVVRVTRSVQPCWTKRTARRERSCPSACCSVEVMS